MMEILMMSILPTMRKTTRKQVGDDNVYAPSLSLSLRNQMVISSWDPYHVNRNRFEGARHPYDDK